MASYALTAHETVTVSSAAPDRLEAEVTWAPRGKLAPVHLHPSQDEHFEILEGAVRVVRGGEERMLGPGDTLDIPRGTPHRMGAAGGRAARARWVTTPALRTEEWWAAIDRERSLRGGGDPPLPVMAGLLREYADVFRLTVPMAIQRPLLALAARVPAGR